MANKTLAENVAQVKADFKGIRDELMNKGADIPSGTPTSKYANIIKDLNPGGNTEEAFEQGKQAQYDEFWDGFQQNGSKTNYNYAFYGTNWNDAIFKPKYDIVPTAIVQTFYNSPITDLTSILEKQGVVLDTSNCTNFSFAFAHSKLTNIPKINMSTCTNSSSTFVSSRSIVRIEGIVSSEKTIFDKSTFQNCSALKHIIFEGTIASDITLQWSKKLDRASILSLLQCLNATVSGITATLPSKCIDTVTDTLALIQGDTELNTAYTQALANGYTITFA